MVGPPRTKKRTIIFSCPPTCNCLSQALLFNAPPPPDFLAPHGFYISFIAFCCDDFFFSTKGFFQARPYRFWWQIPSLSQPPE